MRKHPEKTSGWRGGYFYLYSKEFNKELKASIRERDKYRCQLCGILENEVGHTLCVHHVDYNPFNNENDNLVALCRSCHSKTNGGPELRDCYREGFWNQAAWRQRNNWRLFEEAFR
jgi:5-methylcytosine-specific restriction endonuclease McrA